MSQLNNFLRKRDFQLFNAVITSKQEFIIPDDRFTFWYNYHFPSSIKDARKLLQVEKDIKRFFPKNLMVSLIQIKENKIPLIFYYWKEDILIEEIFLDKDDIPELLSLCDYEIQIKNLNTEEITTLRIFPPEEVKYKEEILGYSKTFPSFLGSTDNDRSFSTFGKLIKNDEEEYLSLPSPTEEEHNGHDHFLHD